MIDHYAQQKWPEYYIEFPTTTALACPVCEAVHVVDVDVDEGHASARIDTDRCEGCGLLMCPCCPGFRVDGLRFCKNCKEAAETCSKECGKPVRVKA